MNTTTKFCVPLTVYYDKSCLLCVTQFHALRDADWRGRLRLQDCSAAEFDDRALAEEGVSRQAMMTRLHVRDPEGRWLVGVDAIEAVYGAAGLNGAARFWGNPRLRPLLQRMYPWFARYRQVLSRLGLHRLIGPLLARAGRRY